MTLGAARVIYSINDLSMYVDQLMRGYVIAVVQCERGPVWEPTPVGSWDEYERIFGRTISGSTDPLVIKMGLLQGAKFVIIRIVNCTDPGDKSTMTAVPAEVTLTDRGNIPTPAVVESEAGPWTLVAPSGGTVTGTEVGPFTFGTGTADAFTVAVGSGDDQTFTLSGSAQTASAVVDAINAATTDLTASVVDNKICLTANTATDTLVIKAVANDCYSVLGFNEGTYAINAGTNSLVVSVNGGANQTFALTAGVKTASEIVAMLTTLTGADATASSGKLVLTTSSTGPSYSIQVQDTSTAPLGFDNDLHEGTNGISRDTLTFTAANPGEWGNSLKVYIHEADLNPGSAFDVRITYSLQGGLDEYYADVNMDPESDRYVIPYINERSRMVTVVDENSVNPPYTNRPQVNDNGTSFTLGDNGDPIDDADYIGDSYVQTGMYAADPVDLSIDIMIPGTTSISVLQALVAYCENRGDLVAYGNTPVGLDPINAKKWRMGELPYTHEAFNSHRFALFFGRPDCYDSRFDKRLRISNLGHLASCLGKTDVNYDYHYAPIGPRRGTVDFVEGLDFNLNDYRGYADLFADYGIDYLMICRQQGIEGAVFWENYTTQRAASALRELNVVRFLTMMRKVLLPLLRTFLFEPNHPQTWREIHRELEPVFQNWKNRYSIYDYVLQTDRDAWFDGGVLKNAVLNSGLEIDQGIYRARALVQPTRAIRYLEFEVGVMRTGESFANYTELKELPGWVRS